jgi:hypothetical protein
VIRRIVAAATLAGVLLAGAAPGAAAVGDDRIWFRLGVFAGYRLAGDLGRPDGAGVPASGLPVDDAATWGLRAGFPLGERFEIQALFSRSRTTVVGETWSTIWMAGLSHRFVSRDRNWFPFLGLSAGGHTFSPSDGDVGRETGFAVSLDGGAEIPVGSRFSLRAEIRGVATRVSAGDAFCTDDACAAAFPDDEWSLSGEATGGFVFAF